jgi:hypothetical protein
MIGGHTAWENNALADDLGKIPMGRLLRSVIAEK